MSLRNMFPSHDDYDDDCLDHHPLNASSSSDYNASTMMRKVRSLDFTKFARRPSNDSLCNNDSSSCAASKFSKDARFFERRRSSFKLTNISLAEVLENNDDGSCTPHQRQGVADNSETTTSPNSRLFSFIMIRRGGLSVGYLSVLALAFVTFTNFALDVVNAQIHQLDSPLTYDALSTEVISPPFRYKSSLAGERPRLGLGTAAISSVTTALSPILPFTGGVDLRREEHWEGEGWFHSLSSVMEQVRDAFGMENSRTLLASSIPRGGGHPPPNLSATKPRKKKNQRQYNTALSASKPFVSVDDIADMTLTDVTTTFRYAIESNRADFDSNKFNKGLSPKMKKVVSAMDATTAVSRGKDVAPARTEKRCPEKKRISQLHSGDVDALQFLAAMRIFAEWRVVRQVPDGYKGYAVGMNLGHKDVVQNVYKIENAVHSWIDYNRDLREMQSEWDSSSQEVLRSPTLRELLQHEVDMELHPSLPRLKEKTAAMGLLWVRRQLHYQTTLFANVIKVPDVFPSTSAAVAAAYKKVYDKYHGWAVQKIFNYSFQAAPEAEEIYKFMNPRHLNKVKESAQKVAMKNVEEEEEEQAFAPNSFKEPMNPVEKFGNHIAQEWDKLGKHVGGEWDKLVSNVVGIFDKKNLDVRGGGSKATSVDDDALEQYVRQEMSKDAHQHILVYLETANPLLSDLSHLFDDLNMDDPTKV